MRKFPVDRVVRSRVSPLALAAGLVLPSLAAAQQPAQPAEAPPPAAAVAVSATASDSAPPDSGIIRPSDHGKDVPWKPFGEVTRNAEVETGLFTAYVRRDQVLLGIKPSQFDRDFLLVTQVGQGIGDAGLDGGTSLRSDLVRFHRSGDRVELWVVNPHVAAAAGSPMALTVAYSFGHSVAQSFPIATIRDTSEILVDVEPMLLSDWADLTTRLEAYANRRHSGANVQFDRDRSSMQSVHVYPSNLESEVRLTYAPSRNLGLQTVPDYRWIPLGIHYSLLELPATPMRPRYADDRVGYFISALKDFSRDTADGFFVRYIDRWRLEKKDPAARLSEPVRPITYYIDRTVPTEWRPYVRAGILEWNRAFEDAGFKNAIRVLDAPDDSAWSAEDARYSTVRWTATNNSVYAIGPSNVDPRTGEILNADILISASWVQTWRGELTRMAGPSAFVDETFEQDSVLAQLPMSQVGRLCSYAAALGVEGTVLRAALAERGSIPAGGMVPREYIGQALKELVMHEVGHTLGLRHNFRGSAGITRAQLADRAYTAQQGIGVSVMDYDPPAVSLEPDGQGEYYASTIGSYDRWAVEYGYAPVRVESRAAKGGGAESAGASGGEWSPDAELPGLRAIAARASDPGHLYGTDEDAGFGGFGLDPLVSRYDQTDDPLGWARERVGLIDTLFDSLETRVVASGQSYYRLRDAFTDLLSARWYAMLVTTKYVGGATTSRDHRDDPGGRPPIVNIPAEKQREALAFLTDAGFGEGAYQFRPELLSRLAPDRWMHWDSNPSSESRIDFPLHHWALTEEAGLLNQLLDPAVLARIRDAELRAGPGEEVVTIPELFGRLTTAIWAEVGYDAGGRPTRVPRNTSSIRRDVQRLYLADLIKLLVTPRPGTPEDARAVARATLTDLGDQIDRALARGGSTLDAYTRDHLADSRVRIDQALDAEMIQPADSGH
ncbi:MAG TPA: zinc-dependent metalloprotease [Gemmatimonadales bacterium]|nr:zinc-dependent metalloprotease [Gemmatimonadales bacterium]